MGGGEDGRGHGRLFEAGRLLTFSAFRMGAYSRWALIRGCALIRINTVCELQESQIVLGCLKENIGSQRVKYRVFFSRLAASRRTKAHREALNEDVQAEEEEQERRVVLEKVATHFGPKHRICYDSYCLCDLPHEKKLETFSVAMLKDMLKYFEIPFRSCHRKKIEKR